MFKLFGKKKEDKINLEALRTQKCKNRLLYLKALEKYDNLKIG